MRTRTGAGCWATALLLMLLSSVHASRFQPQNPHQTGFAALDYAQLIANARSQLGLPAPGAAGEMFRLSEVIDMMYNPGLHLARMGLTITRQEPQGRLDKLVYLRIFKCGNNAVRCNMGCCGSNGSNETNGLLSDDISPERTNPALISDLRSLNFTFFAAIREPAEKFISGFVELCIRMQRDNPDDPYCPRYFASETPLADFLADFLSADRSRAPISTGPMRERWLPQGDLRHIATLTADIRPIPIDILAETRDLPALWKHLYKKGACDKDVAPSYNPNLCSHSSTPETVQLRKRSMIEISTNRATATALCWLLYPDYVNFGYRLPSICTIKQLLPARAVGAGHNSKPNRHTIAGN